MLDEQTERQGGSFIVRIWWEPGSYAGVSHWRGWVQHVRNGEQISFRCMAELAAFIEQEIGIQAATEEAARGLG